MNTRMYTVRDLEISEELSGQLMLCLDHRCEQLLWVGSRFLTEVGYASYEPLEELIVQGMQPSADHKQGTLFLYDCHDQGRYFSYTCKLIQLNEEDCYLMRLQEENRELFYDRAFVNRDRLDAIPCGLFCVRVENHKLYCEYNTTYFYKILGYGQEELTKEDMLSTKIIHPDDVNRLPEEIFRHINQKDDFFELEYRVRKKDGSYSWILARVVPDLYKHHYLAVVLDNTKHKELFNRLRISEEEKRIALQQGNLYIMRYLVKSKTLYITDEGALSGEQHRRIENIPDAVIGKSLVSKETVDDFVNFFQDMQSGKKEGTALFQQRLYQKHEYFWVKAKYTMIYDERGEADTAIISYEDYSEIYEKELAYERWISEFDQKKKDAIAYYEYDLTNDKFETLEGKLNDSLPKDERHSFTYIAHYAADHFVYNKDRKKYLKVFSREYLLEQYAKGRRHLSLQHRRLHEDGTEFWALGEIRMIWDPYAAIVKASVLLYDIDGDKRRAIELKRLSETDSLTGLYNRGTLFRRMESTLRHSGSHVRHIMILIDLDHFKNLNDTFGHQYGDKVLQRVASAIRSCCRDEDVCSRIGGDEFVVFIRNMPLDVDVKGKLEALKQAISLPDEEGHIITASIGAALYPEDGRDAAALYNKADESMYHAKRSKRRSIQL